MLSESNIISSPIAVFCYNRPEHLKKTLDALSQCTGIKNSWVYIFQDGPKKNASEEELSKIISVKNIIGDYKSGKETIITCQKENIGLNASIEFGISKVFELHDRIIVLEDDILVAKGFIEFMNKALHHFHNDPSIWHISGYTPQFIRQRTKKSPFLLRTAQIWGWATWKKNWELLYNINPVLTLNRLRENQSKAKSYNFHPSLNYLDLLSKTVNGDQTIWDTKWSSALFVNEKLSYYPYYSLCKNIGLDASGIHCKENSSDFFTPNLFHLQNESPVIDTTIKRAENSINRKLIQLFLSRRMGRKQFLKDLIKF